MNIITTFKPFVCICIVIATALSAQAKDWKGIVPLHTTRADVERLIGLPSESNSSVANYDFEDAKVTIRYTIRGCVGGNEWDVPIQTVISIVVHPKSRPRFMEMHLDLTKFKREAHPRSTSIVYFINKEDGMSVETAPNEETVESISYMATARDTTLRCPARNR